MDLRENEKEACKLPVARYKYRKWRTEASFNVPREKNKACDGREEHST